MGINNCLFTFFTLYQTVFHSTYSDTKDGPPIDTSKPLTIVAERHKIALYLVALFCQDSDDVRGLLVYFCILLISSSRECRFWFSFLLSFISYALCVYPHICVCSQCGSFTLPERSEVNSDAVVAGCGSRRPEASSGLLDSDPWFPNTTLAECTNRLYELAADAVAIEDYYYIVLVTNPVNVSVVAPSVYGQQLDESPYRSLETLLYHFNPPIASVRRTETAGPGVGSVFFDLGSDLELGIVAVRREVAGVLLPLRAAPDTGSSEAGAADWAWSTCVFWAVAKAHFPRTTFRFNGVRIDGRQTQGFMEAHYAGTGREAVREAACEAAMSWVAVGIKRPAALAAFFVGRETTAWLE